VCFLLSPSKPGQSQDLKAAQEFSKIEHANARTRKSAFFEFFVFMYEVKIGYLLVDFVNLHIF